MSSLPFQTATQTKYMHTHTYVTPACLLACSFTLDGSVSGQWPSNFLASDTHHMHTHTRAHTHTHVCAHARICVHAHASVRTHTCTRTHTRTHTDAQLAAQVLQLNTGPRTLDSTQVRQTAITDLTLLPLCCGLALTYMPVFASGRIHPPLVSQSTVHCTSLHRYKAHVEHSWC